MACSSLKLAYHIEPGKGPDSGSRDALTIVPNPTMEFLITEPLFAYFEIYNLSYNREGTTEYTIRFRLQEKQKNRNLLNRVAGLFGGREGYQVSVENTQSGPNRSENDYISFDMSRLKKGDYELVLMVIDHVSGDEATTKANFILK